MSIRLLPPVPNRAEHCRQAKALVRRFCACWVLLLPVALALAPRVQGQDQEADPSLLVRSITVVGDTRVRHADLAEAYGIHVGEPFDAEHVDRLGTRRVFDRFHLVADVFIQTLPSGGVDVRIELVRQLALDLEPRFVGNVEVDDEDLLEWAGLREREELFLYRAPRVRERLLRAYREKGFYFVQIQVIERQASVNPDTGFEVASDVIFEIEEGPQVHVRDVLFTGNDAFVNQRRLVFFKSGLSKLAEAELSGPWLFSWFADEFVEDTLEADLLAMRKVYRDNGYLDAIVEMSRLEFSEDRSWVTVHVAVDEGGQYEIGSVSVVGVEEVRTNDGWESRPVDLVFPEAELLELLKLRAGDVYQPRFHVDDERELRRRYGEKGYISHRTLAAQDRWAFLDPELVFDAHESIVHVTYRLTQGRQIFIREIPIVGNTHTQDRVIRRNISVKPGDAADPVEIERARARIQSTGFFSDPQDIRHREPSYRYIDTEDPSWKDLEFTVSEGQVLTFNISGGISSNNGAFGQVALTIQNFDWRDMPRSLGSTLDDIVARRAFHGAGQRLQLRAAPGGLRSSYTAIYTEPDLFDSHEDRVSLTLSVNKIIRRQVSHDEERDEIGFQVGYSTSFDSHIYTGYKRGSISVDEIDNTGEPQLGQPLSVPAALRAQKGTTDLAYVLLGYSYSERDNRVSTRNGLQFSFDNKIYAESIGSEAEFIKSELRFDWWSELDDDPDIVSPYYHLQLAGGVTKPYGASDATPYTERFFLGGLGTLRGYRYRRVGPNENGFPEGGQSMLRGSLEYRIPLVKQIQPGTYREYESIQGGVFVDFGVTNGDDFKLDFDDMRASAGILFGITVPIPITFSFGWPIRNVDDGSDKERVFGFNIGL